MSSRPEPSAQPIVIGILTGGMGSALGALLSSSRRLDLGALELAFIAGAYPAMAFHDASHQTIAMECAVSGVFVGTAMVGLRRRSRLALAAGLVAHAGWDVAHHMTVTGTKTPRWFPTFCMVADLALAAQFLMSG
jgi:hypothetical protein